MLAWLRKHKNLVEELPITRPEQVFVSDITYVFTDESYGYLSLVTKAYSKQIIGAMILARPEGGAPLQALSMALKKRELGN